MKITTAAMCALALLATSAPLHAQEEGGGGGRRAQPPGPIQGTGYRTEYIRLAGGEGLLYAPTAGAPKHIALIYSHPGGNNFNFPTGPQLASRGYLMMNVNYRGNNQNGVDVQLPTLSAALAYLKTLPGITKVVVVGHSGGTHQMALYDNVAEHGPSACNGPEKIVPCQARGLDGLVKPDGVILLDPPTGAMHQMSALDPAVDKDVHVRNPALDMWSAANGYDAKTKTAHYSADFAKRFYAAQSARNNQVIDAALARLKAVKDGKSQFSNDEPIVIPGMGWGMEGARLYAPDLAFASHTKVPHLVLKGDGARAMEIVRSVRPPADTQDRHQFTISEEGGSVRAYLTHSGIRTTKDFAITDDDIVGVDWKSAYDSTGGNAYGINAPTLVMVMGCHYLIVPGEVAYDQIPAKDKTFVGVEGAVHGMTPCKPQYGDTMKRTFDFIDEWLSKPGRF